jgi:hypothetical protein
MIAPAVQVTTRSRNDARDGGDSAISDALAAAAQRAECRAADRRPRTESGAAHRGHGDAQRRSRVDPAVALTHNRYPGNRRSPTPATSGTDGNPHRAVRTLARDKPGRAECGPISTVTIRFRDTASGERHCDLPSETPGNSFSARMPPHPALSLFAPSDTPHWPSTVAALVFGEVQAARLTEPAGSCFDCVAAPLGTSLDGDTQPSWRSRL